VIQSYRVVLVGALIAVLIGVAAIGGLASQDKLLQDIRFGLAGLSPTGKTVLVEIDSRSIAEIGVWPWPRRLHAQVLDQLLDMGVEDVAFDIDFSSASTSEDDALFAEALERAGGYAWLGAFQQATTTGMSQSLPLPELAAQAEPVAVNVLLDGQGLVREFLAGMPANGVNVPALAAVLSGVSVSEATAIGIDYGIDAAAIPRFSFSDVLNGRVDPAAVRDRDVIIGASAVELRDLFQTPRFGTIPGPMVQALATETLLLDRALKDYGFWPSAIALGVLGLLMLALQPHLSIWALGALGLAAMVLWEGVAIIAYLQDAAVIDTALLMAGVPILFGVELADEVGTQIRQRRLAQNRLAYLATHDAVTGTLSRTGLVEALPSLGQHATIVLIKLSRLDTVRGTLGSEISDAVLVRVSQQLADIASGIHGYVAQDTFSLGLSQALDTDELAEIGQRIVSRLAGLQLIGEHAVMIDVALAAASGANTGDALLRDAEIALLGGKGAPYSRFEAGQSEAIEWRRKLDVDLRQAITRNELHLVYQPQVELSSGRLVGAEALMRWTHPVHGPVSPADFIPLAEETGYIVELGRWALRTACRECTTWPGAIRVGVNLSPAQLRASDVLEDIRVALEASALPPGRLDIELTESAVVEAVIDAHAMMAELKAMGIQLSLDDFGTGYSALSHLSDLPFDKIKVDQSFVRRMGKPAEDTLLHAVIELCHKVGMKTVAEGIETEEQSRQLAAWRCDIGQGYLFSRPVAGSEIVKLALQAGT
jgi:EAL domain-containing protein (putative c-di-GMP-specific phosphodiesterase class I)/CHASE2 domain-containing sensor protein/GGDEF domain-containing protein